MQHGQKVNTCKKSHLNSNENGLNIERN